MLGGHFSLMMLVEIEANQMEGLHEQFKSDVKGMTTSCFDAIDPKMVTISPKIGCE